MKTNATTFIIGDLEPFPHPNGEYAWLTDYGELLPDTESDLLNLLRLHESSHPDIDEVCIYGDKFRRRRVRLRLRVEAGTFRSREEAERHLRHGWVIEVPTYPLETLDIDPDILRLVRPGDTAETGEMRSRHLR